MGLRILRDDRDGMAALYCSTSDWAFGPVFSASSGEQAADDAREFVRWLPADARTYPERELEALYGKWLAEEKGED